jgi:ankyrin repeat protein
VKFFALILLAASLTGCVSPIIRAAADGRKDDVASLLARGANIEARSMFGCAKAPPNFVMAGLETPLTCAVIMGRLDTVKLLLNKGADINARDYDNKTPLDYATSGVTANAAIADILRAKISGRRVETAAPPPAAEPQAKPAVAEKQWWEK